MRSKLLSIIVVFAVFVALSGCQTAEKTVPAPTATEPAATEPAAAEPTANGVTRVLSADEVNAGDTIKVKLYINLNPGQTYYLVDEAVPTEFKITDKEPNKDNHLKLVQIQNAKSNVYEYSVQAPAAAGTYTFGGEYALEGMDKPLQIMGATTITVK